MKLNLVLGVFLIFCLASCASTPEEQAAVQQRREAQQKAEQDRKQAEEARKQHEEQEKIVKKYAAFTTDQLRVKVAFLTQEISKGYFGQGLGLLIAKGEYEGKVKEREDIAMEILRREGESPTQSRPSLEDNPVSASDRDIKACGTGFFITDDGSLISNNHVIEGAIKVRLVTSSGTISAKVVRVDTANDLALLKAEGEFSPLPIIASKSARLGNSVATVGFPDPGLQGFAPKYAHVEIAALSGAADDPKYFQISVPVQPGNSGGALVDEHGNVVGVVAAKLSALAALNTSGALPENVNYAVKSSFLLSFLESVPEVSAKLKEPETKERKFDDVVKDAQQAAVLVLVY